MCDNKAPLFPLKQPHFPPDTVIHPAVLQLPTLRLRCRGCRAATLKIVVFSALVGVNNDVVFVCVKQLAAHMVAALASIYNILGIGGEPPARPFDGVVVLTLSSS